ncbi:MAG: methyltransferase [Pseudomonadota bacterium]
MESSLASGPEPAAPAGAEALAPLTEDAFLGGRVRLLQPRFGYRAATDPVLLAAAVAARPGERVLDVGCGAGAAAACLAARVGGLELQGLELQPAYAALARKNLAGAAVWEGDLFAPPAPLVAIGFDWAMTNPPFFDDCDPPAADGGRATARRAAASPAEWVAATLRRVRSGGRIAVIHVARRLPEVLSGLVGAGDVAVLPLAAREGRDAGRVIVTARKGAKGPFRLAAPLAIHAGPAHVRDEDDFSDAAAAVLRDAAPLTF